MNLELSMENYSLNVTTVNVNEIEARFPYQTSLQIDFIENKFGVLW